MKFIICLYSKIKRASQNALTVFPYTNFCIMIDNRIKKKTRYERMLTVAALTFKNQGSKY